jgi:hypothetical protein
MDVIGVLESAAGLEDRMGLLYHGLSRRFAGNPEICAFWESLSRDEKAHADASRTYRRQRLVIPVHRESFHELGHRMATLERRLKILLSETDLPLGEAMSTCLSLERELHAIHSETTQVTRDPILLRLFGRLGAEDQHHQERIGTMMQRLGSPTAGVPAAWSAEEFGGE